MTRRYLVLYMTDSAGDHLSRGDEQRMFEAWMQEGAAAGRLGPGSPVAGPERAKSVVVRDGRTLITDGPFPEFKEWFAGYGLVEADSIQDAAEYSSTHPSAVLGRILILPVVPLPWEEEDDEEVAS